MLALTGTATQVNIKPRCIWACDKTKFLFSRTSPSSNRHTQVPQVPLQQSCGAATPAWSIASSNGSCLFHWICLVWPSRVNVTSTYSDRSSWLSVHVISSFGFIVSLLGVRHRGGVARYKVRRLYSFRTFALCLR